VVKFISLLKNIAGNKKAAGGGSEKEGGGLAEEG
jgi:hypothetical protein